MAIAITGTTVYYTAAGEVDTRVLNIRTLVFKTAAVAAVSTGTVFTLKDGAGVVLGTFALPVESSLVIPFGEHGWHTQGLELDTMPAGASLTAFLA